MNSSFSIAGQPACLVFQFDSGVSYTANDLGEVLIRTDRGAGERDRTAPPSTERQKVQREVPAARGEFAAELVNARLGHRAWFAAGDSQVGRMVRSTGLEPVTLRFEG